MQNAAWSNLGPQQGSHYGQQPLYSATESTYGQAQNAYYNYASAAASHSFPYPHYSYNPYMPQPIPGFSMPFVPHSHAQAPVQEPLKLPVTEEQPLPPGVDPIESKGVADEKSRRAGEAGGEKNARAGAERSERAVSSGESFSVGGESASIDKAMGKEKSEVGQQEQQQQSQPKAEGFPPDLNEYVLRCFQSCENEFQKNQMETHLKKVLSDAFNSGSAWLKDWTKESLPQVKKEQKRRSRWATPPPASSQPLLTSPPSSHGFLPSGRGFMKTAPVGRGMALSKGRGLGGIPGVGTRGRETVKRDRYVRNKSRSRSSSRSSGARSPYRSRRRTSSSDSGSRSSSPSVLRVFSTVKQPPTKKKQRKRQKKSKTQKKFIMVKDEAQLSQRARRFGNTIETKKKTGFIDMIHQMNNREVSDDLDFDWSQFAIYGTCQTLEKQYFRLTAAPDASLVRPVAVLKRSLQMVKDKWKAKASYRYVCEQFKSIRQDLTVQCVRDAFTVEVYETHARIALEQGDREEFNQCLTQLRTLYSDHIAGNEAEFTAYWILYLILTRNTSDMNISLSTLSVEMQSHPVVKHALRIRSSWALCNYHRFFKLYLSAPVMCPYLINLFIQRERLQALMALTKSFRPTLPVSFIQAELGFASVDDCRSFLQENGGVRHANDDNTLDCKCTYTNLVALSQPQS